MRRPDQLPQPGSDNELLRAEMEAARPWWTLAYPKRPGRPPAAEEVASLVPAVRQQWRRVIFSVPTAPAKSEESLRW